MASRFLLAVGILLSACVAGAQTPQQPARDRVPQPQVGTGLGVIKGKVVDAQTGAAVPRARVRLLGGPAPAPGVSGAQGPQQRAPVLTDEAGAFAYTALPAANYTLQVEKSTYLQGRYPEAGQTVRSGIHPLTLADGQTIENLTVNLYRGGAITGRVLDSHGDPLENIEVRAMLVPKSGRGRAQMRSGGSTNDIGEFRIARLTAGKYILMVVPRRFDFNPTEQLVSELQPIPTYYPGVLSMEQAQPITMDRGMTLNGMDITALDGMVSVVSGVAIDSTGQPLRGNGSLMARSTAEMGSNMFGTPSANAPIRPDGSFQIRLPAGEYVLEARGNGGPQVQPGAPPLVGTLRVSVGGDVSGLAIMLGGGAKISGKIVFEGAVEPPQFPTTNTGQMRVGFSSPDGSLCQSGRTQLAPDWTFTVEGVIGTCRAQFSGNIPKWSVKSIMYDGKDLLDRALTFDQGQQMKDVEIVFTDKRTLMQFQVTDEQGNPTHEYVAMIFSTDKTRWDVLVNGGRYVRPYIPPPSTGSASAAMPQTITTTTSASLSGGVTISSSSGTVTLPAMQSGSPDGRTDAVVGLPVGEYYVVAIDDIDSDSVRDPDTLEQLTRGATRITLGDTGPMQVALKRFKLASLVQPR